MKTPVKDQMPWVRVCKNAPYFELENGRPWTPIGQNDSINWPDLLGLFRKNDIDRVDGYMANLARHGVSCIRIMMEYCQTDHRYLENPIGHFKPNMVQLWDNLFTLCARHDIRLLITPFDTFWMARRWKFHPYNVHIGGVCERKSQWLINPAMILAIKNRFSFFIGRWGGNGALFGWDLWNEIDPANSGKNVTHLETYVEQISQHIRDLELRLYKKTHLQTVSAFAPLLEKYDLNQLIFRHPSLDFASTHFYHNPSIDNPKNAHAAARTTGEMVRSALAQISDKRPFLDSEHGPISYFRKTKKGLPEPFDDQLFLYMQWAHLASGGAGGGMRWPYRHPHTLTNGMRKAQLNMAQFASSVVWENFRSVTINVQIVVEAVEVMVFACGDDTQALLWLAKTETNKRNERKDQTATQILLKVPGLAQGDYFIQLWNTETSKSEIRKITNGHSSLQFGFSLDTANVAIHIRKCC